MTTDRPELAGAVARSEELLRLLRILVIERDMDRVPVLALARGATAAEKARDAELRRALFILEHVDDMLEVHPYLVDEIDAEQHIAMRPKGRAFLRRMPAAAPAAVIAPADASPLGGAS